MLLGERQEAFTLALGKLIVYAWTDHGIRLRLREVQRNVETQKKYVAEGKSKTMNSRHLDCLAADFVAVKAGVVHTEGEVFRPLGERWEALGGRWGGRFHDPAAFLAKNGRDFDPAKDLGWDTPHFEFVP